MPVPKNLKGIGGVARSGIYGGGDKVVRVDVPNPTDEAMPPNRPDVVVRLRKDGIIYILDVACAWEGAIAKREKEKLRKYQPLAADLAKHRRLRQEWSRSSLES